MLGVEHAIKYFSFWDVPRTFAFERGGKVYVLTSEFDEDLDDTPTSTMFSLFPVLEICQW